MDIFVDDNKLDDLGVDGQTLEEALQRVQETACPPGRLIATLRCDGLEIGAGAMAETLGKPTEEFQRLEVYTGTRAGLVRDAMEQAWLTLQDGEEERSQIAQLIAEGNVTDGIRILGENLGVWQQIHDAIAKSLQMLELNPAAIQVNDMTFEEAVTQPRAMLLQIKNALQSQDYVLLADVLQYEFGDVVAQWQAIIEEIKDQADRVDSDES